MSDGNIQLVDQEQQHNLFRIQIEQWICTQRHKPHRLEDDLYLNALLYYGLDLIATQGPLNKDSGIIMNVCFYVQHETCHALLTEIWNRILRIIPSVYPHLDQSFVNKIMSGQGFENWEDLTQAIKVFIHFLESTLPTRLTTRFTEELPWYKRFRIKAS